MQSADVMTTNVITIQPDTAVQEIARLLLKHRISAVPVVDADRRILGIVSEGDLIRRAETKSEGRHSWWLEVVSSAEGQARDFVKTHGRTARDVMTRDVVEVADDTPLREIAGLLEKHHIKRVPVTRDGCLVGIVSRANLLHGLAAGGAEVAKAVSADDQAIRERLVTTLSREAGLDTALINVVVNDGVVQLWGLVGSNMEKEAAHIAAASTSGVTAVENNLGRTPPWISAY